MSTRSFKVFSDSISMYLEQKIIWQRVLLFAVSACRINSKAVFSKKKKKRKKTNEINKKVKTGLKLGPCTWKFYYGATLAGHFHFGLRFTISVHKFQSTTTSMDILPPRYSFIACACAHMNELKMPLIKLNYKRLF